MPDLIRLLPDAIANKIAAGEVIQRPASVVKELVENAVDAEATEIQVIVKDAGKSLIRVVDNGKGMSATDARMSFERHATSKLRTAEDLFAVGTMGFRGEALASIAAVAQVELRTRRDDDELGTRIAIEGSKVLQQEPCQTPAGTIIDVKNLFFNVPARRKFLKSDPVEFRHIADEFVRIALAYPEIVFTLHHNDQEIYRLFKGNLRQRAVAVLGKKYNENLVPVSESTSYTEITGFIGKPDIAKKSRGEQYIFVNKRFIKSGYLHHAIKMAFENILPEGTHPLYLIYLDIEPARIDVNVHPTKQEIKFEDERLIYNYLRVAAKHALGKYSVTPSLDFEQETAFAPDFAPMGSRHQDPLNRPAAENLRHWQQLYEGLSSSEGHADTVTLQSQIFPDKQQEEQDIEGSNRREAPFQVHNALLISHIKSGVVIVDQQAAHERILYERYLKFGHGMSASVQKVLFPVTIELNATEAAVLNDIRGDINAMGFEVEEFGGNSAIVHGVPPEVSGSDVTTVVTNILDAYLTETDQKPGVREKLAKALSIQAAKKRGTYLAPEERQSLLDMLFACENPYTSPTGRKCFITIELGELMQRFN